MTAFIDVARALTRELISDLSDLPWRHHGLGMLQAEISHEVRLHIWHPKLRVIQKPFREVHDHRFDIRSAVIFGEVTDCIYSVFLIHPGADENKEDVDRAFGKLTRLERVPAFEVRHAKIQTGTDEDVVSIGDVWVGPQVEYRKHRAGTEYTIPRRSFHTTQVSELAVTMIHRSNFDTRPARVLGASDTGIVRDADRALLELVLSEAARKLSAALVSS